MNFTFYSKNKCETTSCFELRNWTGTAYVTDTTSIFTGLIDRTATVENQISMLTGAAFCELRYTFSSATILNSIQLSNINFKNFVIGYNSLATSFSLSSVSGGTILSSWSGNSQTNLIIEFSTMTVESISIILTSITTGGLTGTIGEITACEKILRLPRNPNASNYDPNIVNQKLEVKTIDGGTIVYNQSAKFNAKMKLEWVDQSTTMTDLKGLYDLTESFNFVPYPTGNSWYGEVYECNWVGGFDFMQNKYNYRGTPYYAGTIQLKETPL
jgi:hypothetical protein